MSPPVEFYRSVEKLQAFLPSNTHQGGSTRFSFATFLTLIQLTNVIESMQQSATKNSKIQKFPSEHLKKIAKERYVTGMRLKCIKVILCKGKKERKWYSRNRRRK